MGLLAERFEISRHRFEPLDSLDPRCLTLITPQARFFVRHQGAVPLVDPKDYRLDLQWSGDQSRQFSLDELQTFFPKVTILSTLKCEAKKCGPAAEGVLRWDNTGTAIWGGFQLLELLLANEVDRTARYIAFTGLDGIGCGSTRSRFMTVMPLEAALRPEVLVAYEMNGELLTPEHGAPVRLIAPGQAGAQSVKWLSEITLLPDEDFWR